jgi:hypothetical protein
VAAESFRHRLAPTGQDEMGGGTVTGGEYWALRYHAYTADWVEPLSPETGIEGNSGIPGPIIRAEVDDIVRMHFRNNDEHYRFPHSIHPHGLRYTPRFDGAWVAAEPDKPGTAIPFGGTYTYEWAALPHSVGTWVYLHSKPQSLTLITRGDGGYGSRFSDVDLRGVFVDLVCHGAVQGVGPTVASGGRRFHRSGWVLGSGTRVLLINIGFGEGRANAARKHAWSWLAQGQVPGMRILRLRWPRTMRAVVCSSR